MSFLSYLWNGLINALSYIWSIAVKIVKAVVNFFSDIYAFLGGVLDEVGNDKEAFLVDMPKLIKDARANGHVVDVGLKNRASVGAGVIDPNTGIIESFKIVDADTRDSQTQSVFHGQKVVVLE